MHCDNLIIKCLLQLLEILWENCLLKVTKEVPVRYCVLNAPVKAESCVGYPPTYI